MEKIQWLKWSPEAFEKAKKENKLVLLDIGAAWCHWCHVMDEECYGNPEIANIIRERYVPVRVETDERPDINDRYNQGGWPSTVLLSHDGFVVHGATYLPPPALKELLKQAKDWYDQNIERVSEAAQTMAAEVSRVAPAAAPEPREVKDLTSDIIDDMMKSADRGRGGFGDSAKFPQPAAISLILSQFYFTGEQGLLQFAEQTLQIMSARLLDREEGGLFRYAVAPDWSEPHYEKNLSVNAECLQNYLDACRLTGKKEYAEAAEKIIVYLLTKLSDPAGGFYGSQDADIFDEDSLQIVMEGEAYYRFPASERPKYGEPAIDKTLYVNGNALAISALLEAYHTMGNDRYREVALKSLNRLMNEGFDQEKGVCHYLRDGQKGWPGFLGDTVWLARASLDAYETTAENTYLESARRLMENARERFAAPDGGFYDAVAGGATPPATLIRHKPFADNAAAVEVFARLYNYTADSAYLKSAASTLAAIEPNVRAMLSKGEGVFAAEYALAARYASDGSTKVTIVGPSGDQDARKILREAKRLYRPAKMVQLIDPELDRKLMQKMKYPLPEKSPEVHICTEKGCAAPVKTVDEMIKLMAP